MSEVFSAHAYLWISPGRFAFCHLWAGSIIPCFCPSLCVELKAFKEGAGDAQGVKFPSGCKALSQPLCSAGPHVHVDVFMGSSQSLGKRGKASSAWPSWEPFP